MTVADALQLEVARAKPVLFPLWLRRHAEFEVAEPIHCYIIAFLLLIHYFMLWPWPLTFDLEHSQWRDETLYQIWRQSSNPRRSYCDFNIWPNDLERRVTCCARLWDNFHHKFDLRQLIRAWLIAFFMLIRYVMLWLWPSISWPWTFAALLVSCVLNCD